MNKAGWSIFVSLITVAVVVAAFFSAPTAAEESGESAQACRATSGSFLGTPVDAPFFVFDGGERGDGLGQLDRPAALTVVNAGFRVLLVMADGENHRLKAVTTEGHFQDFWGGAGSEPGRLRQPSGLAPAAGGGLWVLEAGNHRLQRLAVERDDIAAVTGSSELILGRRGSGPGELEAPQAVASDAEGNLYVADTGNHRIVKLSPTGVWRAVWGGPGDGPGRFDSPRGIAVDAAGTIYVADTGNHRIQLLDPAGRPRAVWGAPGEGPGELDRPHGLALDRVGNLYVADTGNHRVQRFDAAGRPSGIAGCGGSGPGAMDEPTALALDAEGYLYVADAGNHRILKLGPQ